MKFISWTNGWKTYATVLVGIGTGVAQYYGYPIPSYVDWILTFMGIGTARMAISQQSKQATSDLVALVSNVLTQVTQTVTVSSNGPTTTTVAPVSSSAPVIPVTSEPLPVVNSQVAHLGQVGTLK